jgi:hypothetical protein
MVRQLLQNLQVRPDLRGHAKAIYIQLSSPNQNTCNNIAMIVAYCKATRSIMLCTDLTHLTLPLLDAMANLPSLESLRLSGSSSGPSIHMVLDHFDLPSLKSLELSRYGIGKGTDPSAQWPSYVPATQLDLDRLLSPDRYHTGNVTSLVLSDPSTPPGASEQILRWPAHLERLSIISLTHSSYAREYTLESIERLLSMHRQSLKFVTIGIVGGGRRGMPDFSCFHFLEELHLSAYELFSETPSNALAKLAAPYLRHLSMTFSTEDQHSESVRGFAMEQVRWMADFAALKASAYPTSRLETIYIGFNPDDNPFWWSDFEDVTWPWDYLDQAVQILAQHGLVLTYSQPTWPKQEWEKFVEQGRAYKALRDAENAFEAEDP